MDSLRKQRSHGITYLPANSHPAVVTVHATPEGGDHLESALLDQQPCLSPSPETLTEHEEALALLNTNLLPAQRKVLGDHFGFFGPPMSTREIAEREGVTHTAIEGRIDRALRAARRVLQ